MCAAVSGSGSDSPPSFSISGTVCFANQAPAPGVSVTAFDRDMRRAQKVGEAYTDREGAYRIEFTRRSSNKRERAGPNLFVKASVDGAILSASQTVFNAGPASVIDVVVPRPPRSLIERIETAVTPLLGRLAPEALEQDADHQDLEFLAGETGFAMADLARYVLAHRLARWATIATSEERPSVGSRPSRARSKKALEKEFWFALLGGSAFNYDEGQMLTQNEQASRHVLPRLDAPAVRKALMRAFGLDEIPARLEEQSDRSVSAFLDLTARVSLGPDDKPSFTKSALEDAGITAPEKQRRFAQLLIEHGTLNPTMLKTLGKSFKKSEIDDLRTSFRLAELTQGDFSVVRMLKEDFELKRPEQIPRLARLDEAEWTKLLARRPDDIKLPIGSSEQPGPPPEARYARSLERQFRQAFPTAAFAGALQKALENGEAKALRHARTLSHIIDRHPEFDLHRTPIDSFLDGSGLGNAAHDPDLRAELKAVQRLFKFAPRFETTHALLRDGIRSAQGAYRLGESEFVRRYSAMAGMSPADARTAWARAADTVAATLTIVSDLKGLDPEGLPAALPNGGGALARFPNWKNLFQSGDLCHCEHCRSTLSPGAYLADLLMFLRARRTRAGVDPNASVRSVLFGRRPDLGYIELNCANALTPLPYVDIVCEVLEAALAGDENDVELAGLVAMPADAAAAKAATTQALTAASIAVGGDFTLSQVDPADADRWVVHGEDATYLLKKKTSSVNFFAQILQNTKSSSAALRAYPAFVNHKAYLKLKQARFPLHLPFDLDAQEVDAALSRAKVDRWELMSVFARGAGASEGDIAAAYFRIACSSTIPNEESLITLAEPTDASQQEAWGEANAADWKARIAIVDTFLSKSGLEYEQMLQLFDLPFIDPAGDIAVVQEDGSCDTTKMRIEGLDAGKLDRILRFLRLWRKRDWAMWELDLALRSPGIGNNTLDEPSLVNLFYLMRLKTRLGEPTIEELCALFADLNTTQRFAGPHQKRAEGLYQQLFLNLGKMQPLDPAFTLAEVTSATNEEIKAHADTVLATLGIKAADLNTLLELAGTTGDPLTDGKLTLANLSFLWRHAFLAKRMKLNQGAWQSVLRLLQQDVTLFVDAKSAFDYVERVDRLLATGFRPEELTWLLLADTASPAAMPQPQAARFLQTLSNDLAAVRAEHSPQRHELLDPPNEPAKLETFLISLLQKLRRSETEARFFVDVLRDEVRQAQPVGGLPVGFAFPAQITDDIRIRYDAQAQQLHLTGVIDDAQKAQLLTIPQAAGNAIYQQAIEEFQRGPQLALRFFEPLFLAPLASLPAGVLFKNLPDRELREKITYDAEAAMLSFNGIMSSAERAVLESLSSDPGYHTAIAALFDQPRGPGIVAENIWLRSDVDLALPLRSAGDPAADNLGRNLAEAARRGLAYLSKISSEQLVLQRTGTLLGLNEALTRRLLTGYAILPETLLAHFTGAFAETVAAMTPEARPATFEALHWAQRVAKLWGKWKLTLGDIDRVNDLRADARLPDFAALPLRESDAALDIADIVRLDRLLRFQMRHMAGERSFLEILINCRDGALATLPDLAAAIAAANPDWSQAEVEAMLETVDPLLQDDYLTAETWEHLARAFALAGGLNAEPVHASALASPALGPAHVQAVRNLLRGKFGEAAWSVLSVEIQDAVREAKRDALTAYLLTRPAPPDAPGGKWQGKNDLYAYFLLDVEMGACLLTSRLVQATNSVQLFVQRCFMGLEANVLVVAEGPDGDSAWRWWQWMRKYRLWEANMKVFLWPENWIEPELKRDRSPFFRELEEELLQGEINELTVETAFANYLEKLDKVSQLEVAALHQEDDGDEAIVHVFGRTSGAEPHEIYYRTFDYRQWSPWSKVDLDIQGDYLTPLVINGRPFLFWPLFSESNDESGNSAAPLPTAGATSASVPKSSKRLKMRLAVSDYRRDRWSPPRLSKRELESQHTHQQDIAYKYYRFFALDRSAIDGRFYIRVDGESVTREGLPAAQLSGTFDIAGCTGAPEPASLTGQFFPMVRPEVYSVGYPPQYGRWHELGEAASFVNLLARIDSPQNDLTLENGWTTGSAKYTELLKETPGFFRVTSAWHLSYMDRLLQSGMLALAETMGRKNEPFPLGVGAWLPLFYADKGRTFLVLPAMTRTPIDREPGSSTGLLYYPDLKRGLRSWEASLETQIRSWVDAFDLATLSPAQRSALETALHSRSPGDTAPPFTDEEFRNRLTHVLMRFAHLQIGSASLQLLQSLRFHFLNFYHPFACDFARILHDPRQGVQALMSRETQFKNSGFSFRHVYWPSGAVIAPSIEDPALPPWQVTPGYPKEIVDFAPSGAYSSYNWELFFHAPLLIANALSRNQRFAEARDWYHFIFNPIGPEGPGNGGSPVARYWITKPFFETTDPTYLQQRIEALLHMLAGDPSVPGFSVQARDKLLAQVLDWRAHPYEPHRIAAYRTVAYQKTVLMKYLDNLLSWGDHLFRQDSMESINEATQLYILAAELLGPRPKTIPPQTKPADQTFNELEHQLDAVANALVEVENLVPPPSGGGNTGQAGPPLPSLYFCIPHNEKLLAYWDRVSDRLYKIRNCLNIDGVARQLALFEPPIDSALLVKARAVGLDIGAAFSELNAPLPLYRFAVTVQKANEVCNDVKALGAALLAALEKKDGEALALLRQGHELRALNALKAVRRLQVDEAGQTLQGLHHAKEMTERRRDFYRDVEKINDWEEASRISHSAAIASEIAATLLNKSAGAAHLMPQVSIGSAGIGGSPVALTHYGGNKIAEAGTNWAAALSGLAGISHSFANLAGTQAGYERRWEEWKLQESLAEKELEQLDRQIVAAELRLAIATREQENLLEQIEDAQAIDEFMRSKFTSEELYQWQVGQIANTYFESYRLAHDLAKRAERCLRFELGLMESDFISYGYWDSLKKGLLAGEKLQVDLRRLEAAYLEQNRREFELTKHVSVAQLDPLSLIELRETGRCQLSLPETIFDLDYPGHYFRTIASVSLTLPAVAGPYTTIGCTLRLLRNEIRITSDVDGGYARATDGDGIPIDDPRFLENNIPVKSIAVSSGQNDSGMFEFSFRDERYLPFEGAGAISRWSIELFHDVATNSEDLGRSLRQFDYDTISDVILHLKYTAREDAGALKAAAISNLREHLGAEPPNSFIALDLRRQFASHWSRFLHPTDPQAGNIFELDLSPDFFPSRDAGHRLAVVRAALFARPANDADELEALISAGSAAPVPLLLTGQESYGGLLVGQAELGGTQAELDPSAPPARWRIRVATTSGDPLQLSDLLLVLAYRRAN
ncbi:hypothetical protein AB7M37_004885 [Sinorhizobium fredii]